MAQTPYKIDTLERARLACLRQLSILDTEANKRIDHITRITAAHFDVPIALVSLVDEDRQWFKSRVGLEATQTPRCDAFCSYTIKAPGVMVVEDAQQDARFLNNPLVLGAPDIRFYAGAPVTVASTHKTGTLCIIDRKPRKFGHSDIAKLASIAYSIEVLITRIYGARTTLVNVEASADIHKNRAAS